MVRYWIIKLTNWAETAIACCNFLLGNYELYMQQGENILCFTFETFHQ